MKPVLITTKGFKDFETNFSVLQNNLIIPRVLNKTELFETIIEIDELIDADGSIIKELHESEINRALRQIFKSSPEVIIIALINSQINPIHETILENILRTAGYTSIYLSHKIADPAKFISSI
jgi:5-oxoprolinase (ATP-hydrolysing)